MHNGPAVCQEEKERSSAIVEALRREQSEVEEQQKEVIREREAQLEAEREQREALALQLQETQVTSPCCINWNSCAYTKVSILSICTYHMYGDPLLLCSSVRS